MIREPSTNCRPYLSSSVPTTSPRVPCCPRLFTFCCRSQNGLSRPRRLRACRARFPLGCASAASRPPCDFDVQQNVREGGYFHSAHHTRGERRTGEDTRLRPRDGWDKNAKSFVHLLILPSLFFSSRLVVGSSHILLRLLVHHPSTACQHAQRTHTPVSRRPIPRPQQRATRPPAWRRVSPSTPKPCPRNKPQRAVSCCTSQTQCSRPSCADLRLVPRGRGVCRVARDALVLP